MRIVLNYWLTSDNYFLKLVIALDINESDHGVCNEIKTCQILNRSHHCKLDGFRSCLSFLTICFCFRYR